MWGLRCGCLSCSLSRGMDTAVEREPAPLHRVFVLSRMPIAVEARTQRSLSSSLSYRTVHVATWWFTSGCGSFSRRKTLADVRKHGRACYWETTFIQVNTDCRVVSNRPLEQQPQSEAGFLSVLFISVHIPFLAVCYLCRGGLPSANITRGIAQEQKALAKGQPD